VHAFSIALILSANTCTVFDACFFSVVYFPSTCVKLPEIVLTALCISSTLWLVEFSDAVTSVVLWASVVVALFSALCAASIVFSYTYIS
jgi:hypothetical protein